MRRRAFSGPRRYAPIEACSCTSSGGLPPRCYCSPLTLNWHFHRVVQKDYLHLFPDLISRSRYHRVQKFLHSKDLMGIQREMLRLLMNRLRLLAMWLALDSAPITIAESPRWKSARMSIWAAEAGFAPSKQQFFLGFRLHLLVSNTGAICDFVLSPANVIADRWRAPRGRAYACG